MKDLVHSRQELAEQLTEGLKDLPGLKTPFINANQTHVYYVYAMQVDVEELGVSRDLLCDALNAEGVGVSKRYQNIHLIPLYQHKIAYGSKGFPWTSDLCRREITYEKGICPIAETLNDFSYIGFGMCVFDLDTMNILEIVDAFKKVWSQIDSLA